MAEGSGDQALLPSCRIPHGMNYKGSDDDFRAAFFE
jgi:hypothetical protein